MKPPSGPIARVTEPVDGTGTGGFRAGMSDQAEAVPAGSGQLVLHKGLEQRPQPDIGEDRIPRLFQARDYLLPQGPRSEHGACPVALLDAIGVQQHETFYAEGGHGPDHPAQHLGPRQSEEKRDRQGGGRVPVEAHVHLEQRWIEQRHPARADPFPCQADRQLVSGPGPVHLKHVPQPAAGRAVPGSLR